MFNGKLEHSGNPAQAGELDEETGLYYYGARYYDPVTSIFSSVDPLAEKYPSVSPYAYSFNNPIKYIDPDGRSPENKVDPPKWLVKVAKGFEKMGSEYTKIGRQLGGAIKEKWVSLGKWIDNIPKESTTVKAKGDGVDIQGEKAGEDSEYVPTADENAKTTVIEKDFVDGVLAGAAGLKLKSAGGKFESRAVRLAEGIDKAAETSQKAQEVFGNSGNSAPKEEMHLTERGRVHYNYDGNGGVRRLSEVVVKGDTFFINKQGKRIDP